jgi:hypothetical protein
MIYDAMLIMATMSELFRFPQPLKIVLGSCVLVADTFLGVSGNS